MQHAMLVSGSDLFEFHGTLLWHRLLRWDSGSLWVLLATADTTCASGSYNKYIRAGPCSLVVVAKAPQCSVCPGLQSFEHTQRQTQNMFVHTERQTSVHWMSCTIFWSRLTVTLALPADDGLDRDSDDRAVLSPECDDEMGGVCMSHDTAAAAAANDDRLVLADDDCDELNTQPYTHRHTHTDSFQLNTRPYTHRHTHTHTQRQRQTDNCQLNTDRQTHTDRQTVVNRQNAQSSRLQVLWEEDGTESCGTEMDSELTTIDGPAQTEH